MAVGWIEQGEKSFHNGTDYLKDPSALVWMTVGAAKRLSEVFLSGRFGDWLERKLKSIQIKKIESDPRTKKYPLLIVYNDRELRFHPPKGQN